MATNQKRIRCYNDTESREFKSTAEAAKELNTSTSSICNALKSGHDHLGYYFEYLEDNADDTILKYVRYKSDFKVIHTNYDELYKYVDHDQKVPVYDDNLLLPEDDAEDEIWAQIPGYSRSYVSNFHRFKLDIGNGIYRLLKQDIVYIDEEPYLFVFLYDEINSTRCLVDRAIYATYVDPTFPIYDYNPDQIIHHINNNTLDNNPSNLKAIARNI